MRPFRTMTREAPTRRGPLVVTVREETVTLRPKGTWRSGEVSVGWGAIYDYAVTRASVVRTARGG